MRVVQSKVRRKSQLRTSKTHMIEEPSVAAFRPFALSRSRAQCISSPQSTVERKEEAGANNRGPEVRNGVWSLEYIAYVFDFLASIRCNLVFIYLMTAFAANGNLAYYAVLFVSFLFFFFFSVWLPVANAPDVPQPCGLLYYP
jgi:hypothetical protein